MSPAAAKEAPPSQEAPALLGVLRCPRSGQSLQRADAALVSRLQAALDGGRLGEWSDAASAELARALSVDRAGSGA